MMLCQLYFLSQKKKQKENPLHIDNNLESNNSENQNKMKYESMLKKMLEYEKEYKYISKGNYNEDDRTFLSGFLDTLEDSNPKNKKIENIQLPQEINEPNMNLCNGELNSFYNMCNY
uniref:Uncharacterized protein n=1 Tax=Sipha flava TaxID=143950 RepID=A0A2S2Q324_9HEMI